MCSHALGALLNPASAGWLGCLMSQVKIKQLAGRKQEALLPLLQTFLTSNTCESQADLRSVPASEHAS